MSSLLFEITPLDVPAYAAAAVVLTAASLAAAYFPARRAARIDPIQALKTD
jgi:ABC-type antimicrobial peptide transport system permease subunit